MKLITIIISILMVQTSFARENLLSAECAKRVEGQAIGKEVNRLKKNKDRLSDRMTVRSRAFVPSYNNPKELVKVVVSLTEKTEGFETKYEAMLTMRTFQICKFKISRQDKKSCRYSALGSPEDLAELPGAGGFAEGKSIVSGHGLKKIEKKQIRKAFLNDENSKRSIKSITEETDYDEIYQMFVTLPNGQELVYYGAHSGDTPFGYYLKAGTTEIAGNDSDSFNCIK